MRHFQTRSILLLTAFSILCLVVAPVVAGDSWLHGRVIGLSAEGDVIGTVAGAEIQFIDESGQTVATSSSDERGYHRAQLTPGRYFFRVAAAGYRTENAGRGFELKHNDGPQLKDFSLVQGETDEIAAPPPRAVVPLGTLWGTVLTETSDGSRTPIARARAISTSP